MLLLLLLLLLWLSFLVIAITIAIFYLCYHWNNSYCYSYHHTDMTSYQNSKYFVCFCWFTFVLPPKKAFLRDQNGNKATQLFCVIPAIAPRMFFLISILHYNLVFDCKFIWKSYVNFSFIELIFVMVKGTYLLTYTSQSYSILSISHTSVAKECEQFSGHGSKQESHVTVRTQR